jgi:hypothetical protein
MVIEPLNAYIADVAMRGSGWSEDIASVAELGMENLAFDH